MTDHQNQQNQPPPPFACTYSPQLPELILKLNCTLVISTYQAGKVLFLSARDINRFIQLPRNFDNAMSIGLSGNKMAIAAKDEVVVLVNEPGLSPKYPNQPNTYDGLFVPRATYYSGMIDIHGLEFSDEGLWAVNTCFSCLSMIDDNYSFVPKWKPFFISKIAPGDKCHLNGMAMKNGKPEYVTALGTGDTSQSWRESITTSGVLIHVPTNDIILKDLPMPHSPRLFGDTLYLLLSASGELISVDVKSGTYNVINKIQGFVRGLAKCGDYLFVGHSRLRKNASCFSNLEIAKKTHHSGVTVIHEPTGAIVGDIAYQATVDEIFDIQVLPGLKRPGILNNRGPVFKKAVTNPETTYWLLEKKE